MVKKKFLKRTVFLGLTRNVFHLTQFTFKISFLSVCKFSRKRRKVS